MKTRPGSQRLFIIDGNSYIYRAFYAIRSLSTSTGLPSNAVLGFANMLMKVITEKMPDRLAIVFDPKGPTRRHKEFKEYKSHRFLITIAADVAAMAPGTHIGAAHPVSGDGLKVDDTMAKKMTSDVAGYARTIATQRKRNVALVEQAVTESRTFTEQEAATATPPLIDLVARPTSQIS